MEAEEEAVELEDEQEVTEDNVTHKRFQDDPTDAGWDQGRVSEDEDGNHNEDDDESLGEKDKMLEEFVDV
jgi:hypothetical protein